MANLLDTLQQDGSFATLVKAIHAADLVGHLRSADRYTVLAPTDAAFAKVPDDKLSQLMANPAKLKRVLLYHVLFGDVRAEDLAETDEAPTVEGSVVAVQQADDLKINDAQVINADMLADNGVIHSIDTVLIPALVEAEA